MIFSSTRDGNLQICTYEIDRGKLNRLTNSPNVWDEHAHYSPDGKKIVWMSSEGLILRSRPKFDLQTEFWVMNADGSDKRQVTGVHYAESEHRREGFVVAADADWSKHGRSFVGLFITGHPDTPRRGTGFIAKIDLPEELWSGR